MSQKSRFFQNISNLNRERKYFLFFSKFAPNRDSKILDVGASEKEYQASANLLEKRYPHPENITVLGVDNYSEFKVRYPKVKIVRYDGGKWPFKDGEFDICWSNAVLEHVGSRDSQIEFLKEAHRVAKKLFITTPNKFFPIEVHTKIPLLHLLPKNAFDTFLRKIGKGWASGDYMNLLSLGDLKKILGKAGIVKYNIVRNRFFGFTIDFVVMSICDE